MAKTAAASRHMERVAELGCVICGQLGFGYSPCELHHIYDSSEKSDFLVIGLCPEHHRGKTGFHGMGERAFNRLYRTSETHLLAKVLERLA